MTNFFLNLDSSLFYFINSTLSNSIFDFMFVPLHKPQNHLILILLFLSILIYYIYNYRKKGLFILMLTIFGFIITDFTGSIIKNFELRKRPYMIEEEVRIPNGIKIIKDQNNNYKETESSKKSFPSNHASNIFFICSFLSYIYKNKKKYFISFAILVSISRVYIGVHYPLDIISGAIIGITISFIIIKGINLLRINLEAYRQEA